MSLDEPQPPVNRPRRFRPRFTLRLLLVLVTAVGVVLAIGTHRARQQRLAVQRIAELGGGSWVYDCDRWDQRGNQLPPSSPVPTWLLTWLGKDYFHNVVHVEAWNRDVLSELDRLPHLESLSILDNAVTDSHFEKVGQLTHLKTLHAEGDGLSTELGDPSLVIIGRLPRLESVRILGTGFSLEGLRSVGASKSLRHILIDGCDENVDAAAATAAFSSHSIEHLHIGHKNLRGEIERIVNR